MYLYCNQVILLQGWKIPPTRYSAKPHHVRMGITQRWAEWDYTQVHHNIWTWGKTFSNYGRFKWPLLSAWMYVLFLCRITVCIDIFCGILGLSSCLRKGICFLNRDFEIGKCKNLEALLVWQSHFTSLILFVWWLCLNSLILNVVIITLYYEASGFNPLARTSVHNTLYTSAFCHTGLNLYLFQMLKNIKRLFIH